MCVLNTLLSTLNTVIGRSVSYNIFPRTEDRLSRSRSVFVYIDRSEVRLTHDAVYEALRLSGQRQTLVALLERTALPNGRATARGFLVLHLYPERESESEADVAK